MINREDMLELTRRMTPARSHIDRIAGAYYDAEGYIDGTFNTHFLKLSTAEKTKNLELAKAVLQAETNKQPMLSLSAKIFCSRLPQSEIGYSTKILYRLFGLLPYWVAIF